MRPIIKLAVVALWIPVLANAQNAPLTEDATVPRPGTMRVGISLDLQAFDRRFARADDGSREPLGADFSTTALGVTQLPRLGASEIAIRALAGNPTFALSLGAVAIQLDGRVERIPMTMELGLLRRLSIFATVPFIRTRMNVEVRPGIGADATAGLNPALTNAQAFSRDTAIINALDRARAQLRSRIDQCAASTASDCAAINNDRPAAETLVSTAASYGTALSAVYLAALAVPVIATPVHTAVSTQIAAFKTGFGSYGVTEFQGAPDAPAAATPLTYSDLSALVRDPEFGIQADSLASVDRVSLGDIEVGGKVLLFDGIGDGGGRGGFGVRFAATGLVRLGTSNGDQPHNPVDIAPGDSQRDIEVGALLDVRLGRRATTNFAARYVRQLEDETTVRVPAYVGQALIPLSATATVNRDLGDIVQLEIAPQFALHESFAIAGWYRHTKKQRDRYTGGGLGGVPEAPIPDVALLGEGTEITQQDAGLGITFSNLAAYNRGRARFPYEIAYLHYETIGASGGPVPSARGDRIRLRVYVPAWRRNRKE